MAESTPRRVNAQVTGAEGVYLVAAEMTRREFIVAPTARSMFGADLLVTDRLCTMTWSVQVKTNRHPSNHWGLSENATRLRAPSHVYVLVNLHGDDRPEFYVVPSAFVVGNLDQPPPNRLHPIFGITLRPEAQAKYKNVWDIFAVGDFATRV